MERVRGTCVAVEGAGVLLRGRSGSGKSDLALRLIEAGGRLVSDDYTCVEVIDGGLVGRAPEELTGLLEVRGVGIVRVAPLASVPVRVVVDLVAREAIDRMPQAAFETIAGVSLPAFRLWAFAASAVAKVRIMVRLATGGILRLP